MTESTKNYLGLLDQRIDFDLSYYKKLFTF